jgi:general stress protein 26
MMKRLREFAVLLFLVAGLPTPAVAQSAKSPAPTRAQIITAATDVMKAARYTTLISLGADGRPQARVVDPAAPDQDLTIWIATNPLTRKVEEIRRDGRVTLLYFDSAHGEYVTVLGTAILVSDSTAKMKHWKSDWAPFYKSGPRGADYLLIRVKPSRLEVVSPSHKIISDPRTWLPASIDLP